MAPLNPVNQVDRLAAILAPAQQAARVEAEAGVMARDAFFSLAAHELRTPLTALLGQAQLLQRRLQRASEPDERVLRSAEVVIGQAGRLNRMVSALLDFSRIEQGRLSIERSPLDLVALARRVVDDMQPSLDQHLLILDACEERLEVIGDALRLEQVLLSMISNAVKFSPPGSTVLIQLTCVGHEAVLAVVDCGIGVPPEELAQLFTRFFRASNASTTSTSGLGIGLYIAHAIITQHGGTMDAESVAGQGSTFRIRLPLK
jgi:signal transduction histidine kinase